MKSLLHLHLVHWTAQSDDQALQIPAMEYNHDLQEWFDPIVHKDI